MYEAFYGFRQKPFSLQPDPEFLYLSEGHFLGYTILDYAVQSEAEFAVMTGAVGAGKSLLVARLLENLGEGIHVGVFSNPHRNMKHLIEWVMLSFGQPYEDLTPAGLFDAFRRFLMEERSAGRRCLLIVEEAQNLSHAALQAIALLADARAAGDPLLHVLLVGQPELADVLERPELHGLARRVAVSHHLSALPASEVGAYIRHRLQVAGRDTPLFDGGAIELVAATTDGIPRRINTLCDSALLYGFARQATLIDASVLCEVMADREAYGVFGDVQC